MLHVFFSLYFYYSASGEHIMEVALRSAHARLTS